jgi:hypothetical protein
MRTTSDAPASFQTLDDLLARLREQDIVDGILLMGTTGTDKLTPASDYDLLLVLSRRPAPLRTVTTWAGGRLTEIYCTTTQTVERVSVNPSRSLDGSDAGTLVNWLRDGRIARDRSGRLAIAQATVRRQPPPALATDGEIHEARRKISYNVAHLDRYLAAGDPASDMAADLRLLYSLFEVALHYFTVRRIPWRGEKAAVRHWAARDPEFLSLLRRCFATTDRREKAALYAMLARRARTDRRPPGTRRRHRRGRRGVGLGCRRCVRPGDCGRIRLLEPACRRWCARAPSSCWIARRRSRRGGSRPTMNDRQLVAKATLFSMRLWAP